MYSVPIPIFMVSKKEYGQEQAKHRIVIKPLPLKKVPMYLYPAFHTICV